MVNAGICNIFSPKPLMMTMRIIAAFVFFCVIHPFQGVAQRNMKELLDIEIMPVDRLIRPDYLKKGDLVAIVAPSGIVHQAETVYKAKDLLESWGLQVVIAPHVFDDGAHFAGTDLDRLTDLQEAMDNDQVRAIWTARGGYGAARIVDSLNFEKIKSSPKWLIGYSDITVLHSAFHNAGMESMHAMMAVNLKADVDSIPLTVQTFKSTLFGKRPKYEVAPNPDNRLGEAKGKLVGGNLTLLQTSLKTPTDLETEGKIIFIEEIGEYKYHLDRMLRQMERSGYFKGCEGLIVGDISNIRRNSTPFQMSSEALILDILKDYDFPILFDFPAGHEKTNVALILGREVQLQVKKSGGKVKFKL